MRIVIGSDHAGFSLKNFLAPRLGATDLGTHSGEPADYPDIAAKVTAAVLSGEAERGIAICGSGAGMAVAANKAPGIRAATAHDCYTARQIAEHDAVNVLCLGSRVIGRDLAEEIVRTYLFASFSGEERHLRRLGKIKKLEETGLTGASGKSRRNSPETASG